MKRFALPLIAVLLLAGCASSEERAAEAAAEEAEMAQDMWEANGNTGPVPTMNESAVAREVQALYGVTNDVMLNGSNDAACNVFGESFDLLNVADLEDAEQQGYVDVMLDDLSQAYSSCSDGRWSDTMPRIINLNLMTEQYSLRY
jgi:hypothetical protein